MSQFSIFSISTGYFLWTAGALSCHGTSGLKNFLFFILRNTFHVHNSRLRNPEYFAGWERERLYWAFRGVCLEALLSWALPEALLSIISEALYRPCNHYQRPCKALQCAMCNVHCVLPPSPCVEAIILPSISFFVLVPLSTLFVIIFAINILLFKFLTCETWFF